MDRTRIKTGLFSKGLTETYYQKILLLSDFSNSLVIMAHWMSNAFITGLHDKNSFSFYYIIKTNFTKLLHTLI
jgi:hypothetical protein